jgi:DNA polymerase
MRTLSIDIETYSSVDLAKSGVYRYAEAPDFEIILFGYSVDSGPVQVVDLASGEAIPQEIQSAILDSKVIKWAFNAQFERVCLSKYFGVWLEPDSWRCTMVWSAYLGLPLSLEGAAIITGVDKKKLTEGKELIRYFSVPCKPTRSNDGRTRNLPEHAPDKWDRFKAYNLRDVEAELSIQAKLQKFPVPEEEWQNYILDQQINDRGIQLDLRLVSKAIQCDEKVREELTSRLKELTELENPNSVVQMKKWLSENGLETDSLDKASVKELLKDAPDHLSEVLELRQLLAKSSVKKILCYGKCSMC